MNFLRGFQAAFRGIIRCINHERNMRIHTVAALYVFVFSFFFEFSITGYAVLFTVFGLIMALEIVNTGLEALADQISPGYSPVVKVVNFCGCGCSGVILAAGRFYPYVRIFLYYYADYVAAVCSSFRTLPLVYCKRSDRNEKFLFKT